MKKTKIFISAGDQSGDKHASLLMKEILELNPNIEFVGIGGENMKQFGLNSIVDIKEISVVGFWEVAKKYYFFKNLLNKSYTIIKNNNIDAFLAVDYPGFNLRLAKLIKKDKLDTKVIHYIAPQLWAWGKNRAKGLADSVDLLLTVFPFETVFFGQYNIQTDFVGHPLLDNPAFENPVDYDKRENLIAILPGSRKQEVLKHQLLLNKVIKLLIQKYPEYAIEIPIPAGFSAEEYKQYIDFDSKKVIFTKDSRYSLSRAKVAIVKAGTSNLEATLLKTPYIMFYKASSLTYHIAKRLVTLPYLSLSNILLKKNAVTELIQDDATPDRVVNEVEKILTDGALRLRMLLDFEKIRSELGGSGASAKCAKSILQLLRSR